MNLSKKEAQQILAMLKQAQPLGMTNDDMADRAMIEYNQGLQPATGAKPKPLVQGLHNADVPAGPARKPLVQGLHNADVPAGPARKPLVQGLHNADVPAGPARKPLAQPAAVTTPAPQEKMPAPLQIGRLPLKLLPLAGGVSLAPTPRAPVTLPSSTGSITIGNPQAGGVSLAPTPQAPVTLPSSTGSITIGNPTGAPKPMMPTPPAPTPAAAAPSGDASEQELQLLQKLHNSKFNSASRRDQEMLRHLRSAGQEAGGYGDFKTLRNLAYAQQYGANSDYGRLAQKWRDSSGTGSIPKMAQYTGLTRRNTGVTTLEGNIWVNPADQEWLNKSAAYAELSWEDYKNLDPAETPENIQTFFTK